MSSDNQNADEKQWGWRPVILTSRVLEAPLFQYRHVQETFPLQPAQISSPWAALEKGHCLLANSKVGWVVALTAGQKITCALGREHAACPGFCGARTLLSLQKSSHLACTLLQLYPSQCEGLSARTQKWVDGEGISRAPRRQDWVLRILGSLWNKNHLRCKRTWFRQEIGWSRPRTFVIRTLGLRTTSIIPEMRIRNSQWPVLRSIMPTRGSSFNRSRWFLKRSQNTVLF